MIKERKPKGVYDGRGTLIQWIYFAEYAVDFHGNFIAAANFCEKIRDFIQKDERVQNSFKDKD